MYIRTKIALLGAGFCISAAFGFYYFPLLRNRAIAQAQASAYPMTLDGTDVSTFGVKYDVRLAQGVISAGSNSFRAAGATVFSSADIGKDAIVYYRGSGPAKRLIKGNVWTGCIARVEAGSAITIGSWMGNSCVTGTSSLPQLTDE
ncbi:MAG TPA: hypothetical protein VGH29_17235, partial [Candidatus Binataceae bacterium]